MDSQFERKKKSTVLSDQIFWYCRTPDFPVYQRIAKIWRGSILSNSRFNQIENHLWKSGEALYSGTCLLVVSCRNAGMALMLLWPLKMLKSSHPSLGRRLMIQIIQMIQTLFFNHRSLDLTLPDLGKSKPTLSPDKPMGQL